MEKEKKDPTRKVLSNFKSKRRGGDSDVTVWGDKDAAKKSGSDYISTKK
jgi:hypothetical protein